MFRLDAIEKYNIIKYSRASSYYYYKNIENLNFLSIWEYSKIDENTTISFPVQSFVF